MDKKIYLDYNASTPVDAEVAATMRPFLDQYYGNPSSNHWYGLQARITIENARKKVASLLQAHQDEIIFTSGGTESNNMAVRGVAYALENKGKHIITSAIEHPSILEVCRFLEKKGFRVTYLSPDNTGRIQPETLKKAIQKDTILVSIMHANNEVGTIQPIKEFSALCKENNILLHTDAAQSAGKIPVNVQELGVDLLSLAGHKLYGPKGVGALYIRQGVRIEKILLGADHEHNLRPGTENSMEIAGLGKACEVAERDLVKNTRHVAATAEALWQGLAENLPDIRRNGNPDFTLPNTLNISFKGIDANLLVSQLENIAVSAGAACHTDKVEISHVLQAMKVPEVFAMGTIRFSTGKLTTMEEIKLAVEEITKTVKGIQKTEGRATQDPEYGKKIALTHFTSGLGCACKMRPQALSKVLRNLPVSNDPNVLVGTLWADDAAVYKVDKDRALVNTIDFFTPVVDDPWWFGAIAAANALSDIYAMGATPLFALNIAGFPSNRLPLGVLDEIIKGGADKCEEAGIPILGGHTIDNNEPLFGMAVTGWVHPEKILTNQGAQAGDMIILTKPIGTGIITTGIKKGMVPENGVRETMEIMATLNAPAADVLRTQKTTACTDITGFGLIGHLGEITRASKVDALLFAKEVPLLTDTMRLAELNIIPGGTKNNVDYTAPFTTYQDHISLARKMILNDAQTSGGLLATLPKESLPGLLKEAERKNEKIYVIGEIKGAGKGRIFVE